MAVTVVAVVMAVTVMAVMAVTITMVKAVVTGRTTSVTVMKEMRFRPASWALSRSVSIYICNLVSLCVATHVIPPMPPTLPISS